MFPIRIKKDRKNSGKYLYIRKRVKGKLVKYTFLATMVDPGLEVEPYYEEREEK